MFKTGVTHLTFTLVLLIWPRLSSSSSTTNRTVEQLYQRCAAGLTFSGSPLRTLQAKGAYECSSQCSHDPDCKSVNLCPEDNATVTCTLFSDHNPAVCDGGLIAASSPSCYVMQKLCKNGGTPVGTQCACPIEYSGKYCERRIRDCTEAYENGYQDDALSGGYFIQPVTSPEPFFVYCKFAWGGVTYGYKRTTTLSGITVDWSTAVSGFGNNQSTNPSFSSPAFIGLENLHHLTSQASYTIHLSMWSFAAGSAGMFYNNFFVGDSSTHYALSYDGYYPNSGSASLAENGFDATLPMPFSTLDNDPSGCAASRGAPGWYGTGSCDGYSIFGSGMTWPASGTDITMDSALMIIERRVDFHVPL